MSIMLNATLLYSQSLIIIYFLYRNISKGVLAPSIITECLIFVNSSKRVYRQSFVYCRRHVIRRLRVPLTEQVNITKHVTCQEQ